MFQCDYSVIFLASIRKNKNGTFTAQVRIKGFPNKAKTFRTRMMAKSWSTKMEDSIKGGHYQDSEDMTVKELLTRYFKEIVPLKKTIKSHKTNINHLMTLGDYHVSNLTPDIIVDYVNKRRKTITRYQKKTSSETVRKEINTLNHVIKTGVALWGIRLQNPVPIAKDILSRTKALQPSKPRFRRLNDGEESKLLQALEMSQQTKLAFMLILLTARRLSEITSIEKKSIKTRNGKYFIVFSDTKTDKHIEIPLPEETKKLMRFRNSKLFEVRTDSLSQAFNRARKRAGVKDITLRDLRREALSRLFERGFNVPEVMMISGHSSPDILLKVYAQVQSDSLNDRLSTL